MEEQHEIIIPVFTSKQSASTAHSFVPKPAVKLTVNDVEIANPQADVPFPV